LTCLALLAGPALAAGPLRFTSVTPCRLFDTALPADAPALVSGVPRAITVQGACGVPSGAKAVVVNITAVGPNKTGSLVAWASDVAMPAVSTLNFSANDTAVSNGAIVALGATTPDLKVQASLNQPGSLHVIVDVTGYFQ
jgi:hypothetical protein